MQIQMGSFTITPDGSATQFSTPIPSGCTTSVCSIGTNSDLGNGYAVVANSVIDGDNLIVTVCDKDSSPIRYEFASSLTINYIVS